MPADVSKTISGMMINALRHVIRIRVKTIKSQPENASQGILKYTAAAVSRTISGTAKSAPIRASVSIADNLLIQSVNANQKTRPYRYATVRQATGGMEKTKDVSKKNLPQ